MTGKPCTPTPSDGVCARPRRLTAPRAAGLAGILGLMAAVPLHAQVRDAPLHAQVRDVPLRAQAREAPVPGDYRVVGQRVDRGTYTGWRMFHTSCHGCHGIGGVGTDVAPNLVVAIETMTPRGFATRVLTSYRITPYTPDGSAEERRAEREALLEDVLRRERSSRGQIVMPAWDTNDKVAPHVLDLYAYLTARAYAGLGPGKPSLLATKQR